VDDNAARSGLNKARATMEEYESIQRHRTVAAGRRTAYATRVLSFLTATPRESRAVSSASSMYSPASFKSALAVSVLFVFRAS
jgi:hypothetical protein